MNEIKLKPCPFCGGEAEVRTTFYVNGGKGDNNEYTVFCKNKDCIAFYNDTAFTSRETATEKWNRRVDDERI